MCKGSNNSLVMPDLKIPHLKNLNQKRLRFLILALLKKILNETNCQRLVLKLKTDIYSIEMTASKLFKVGCEKSQQILYSLCLRRFCMGRLCLKLSDSVNIFTYF